VEKFISMVTERHDMSNHIVTIHDAQTGETVVRELTEQEIAELPALMVVAEEAPVVEES